MFQARLARGMSDNAYIRQRVRLLDSQITQLQSNLTSEETELQQQDPAVDTGGEGSENLRRVKQPQPAPANGPLPSLLSGMPPSAGFSGFSDPTLTMGTGMTEQDFIKQQQLLLMQPNNSNTRHVQFAASGVTGGEQKRERGERGSEREERARREPPTDKTRRNRS